MVSVSNNVNLSTYIQNNKKANTEKLIKYVNNQPIAQEVDTFAGTTKSAMSSMALFEGIPLLNLFVRNLKNGGKFINDNMKKLGELNQAASSNIGAKNASKWQKLKDYASYTTSSSEVYSGIRNVAKQEANVSKLTKKAAKAAEKAAKNPNSNTKQKVAKKLADKLSNAKETLKTASEGLSASFEKASAASTGTVVKTTGKLAGFRNFMKSSGASIMLIFSGISELASEVIPTFKELGVKSGIKQTGKSAVKVVGDTAGYLAGAKAGTILGTKIGTAINPGIGSAVGAAIGFVGGLLGSFVAGKITKAIVGKSEREIATEKQTASDASKIMNDEQMLADLKAAAAVKVQQEQANGSLSKDSIMALQALENLDKTNPFVTFA